MNGRQRTERKGKNVGIRIRRTACFLAGPALSAVLLCPLAAAASEGGGDHAAGFGKPMVYSIINFALLVIAIVYLYRKKASGTFEKRSLEVKIEMEEAAEAKRQAQAKFQEYQKRVASLDREIAGILEAAKGDAEKERLSIRAAAQKQAEKIIQQAELTAKQEVEEAKRQLRREAAELAAEMATELVKKAAKPEDQRNWVQTYIEKIGELR